MKSRIIFIALAAVACSGCISMKYPFEHDKGFPSDGRYEILGDISLTETMTNVLGVFMFGGAGYEDLLNEAQKKYNTFGSFFDVVNISVDRKVVSFLGIVTQVDIIMRGTVIRYNRTPPALPQAGAKPGIELSE